MARVMSLVKLNPARCARLVKLPVVRLTPVGATTPTELTYLAFIVNASSMPSRCNVQAAYQYNVQAQGTPQAAPHHIVVPITDKSTKSFKLLQRDHSSGRGR